MTLHYVHKHTHTPLLLALLKAGVQQRSLYKNCFVFVGRLFNKDGNLKKWWSNSSISAFKSKTQCLIDQYSKYIFHSKNVSHFLTSKLDCD